MKPRSGTATYPTLNDPYIAFARNGSVEGFDSVNGFSGRFRLAGNQLRLAQAAASLIGLAPSAPRALVETQSAFAALISGKPATLHVVGRTMTLGCGSSRLTAVRH